MRGSPVKNATFKTKTKESSVEKIRENPAYKIIFQDPDHIKPPVVPKHNE